MILALLKDTSLSAEPNAASRHCQGRRHTHTHTHSRIISSDSTGQQATAVSEPTGLRRWGGHLSKAGLNPSLKGITPSVTPMGTAERTGEAMSRHASGR